MDNSLTKRQQSVLNFIREQLQTRGYPPSVREIGQALGLTSSSTVHAHLKRLQDKGYIRRDPNKPRTIEVIGASPASNTTLVPLLGTVRAGQPLLAAENIEGYYPLPEHFLRNGEVFMLRVKGTSMIAADIREGDILIVRRQSTATNGDIVVALLDGEATVKRFFREENRLRLQPDNPDLAPMLATDVTILGKVIGLWRLFS